MAGVVANAFQSGYIVEWVTSSKSILYRNLKAHDSFDFGIESFVWKKDD
jgi:hypothetical protein